MYFCVDDFIAGWIGGVCGLIVGHPLDTIKVRQQTYGANFFTTLRRTYKYEQFKGFYKGMFFPLLTVGPSNSIFFGFYGNLMRALQQNEVTQHTVSPDDVVTIQRIFMAGCIAGFFQVLFYCPIELVKTVLQARTGGRGSWKKHYEVIRASSFQNLRDIYKERGFLGLYRGGVAMTLRDVPTSGIYTLTYEMLLYWHFSPCNTPPLIKQMIAGGTAGFFAWIMVMPFDVVKTRIEADNPNNPAYRGTIDCIVKSYKMGGFKVFFRGLPIIAIRSFPVNAVINVGYETTLVAFKMFNIII